MDCELWGHGAMDEDLFRWHWGWHADWDFYVTWRRHTGGPWKRGDKGLGGSRVAWVKFMQGLWRKIMLKFWWITFWNLLMLAWSTLKGVNFSNSVSFQDLSRSLVHNFCEAKKSLLKLRRHFDLGLAGVRQRIVVKEALPEGLVTPTWSNSYKERRGKNALWNETVFLTLRKVISTDPISLGGFCLVLVQKNQFHREGI